MTWHEVGEDTLTLSVYDTGNLVNVPLVEEDGIHGSNWEFDTFGGQPGGEYLIGPAIVFRLYVSGSMIAVIHPERFPRDGDVWTLRQRSYYTTAEGDTIPASRPLVPGSRYRVNLTGGGQDMTDFDLHRIRVVPNPYLGYAAFEFGPDSRKVQFVNLPAECTIRIYTISGVLVRVLEHTPAEGGTEDFDLRRRVSRSHRGITTTT